MSKTKCVVLKYGKKDYHGYIFNKEFKSKGYAAESWIQLKKVMEDDPKNLERCWAIAQDPDLYDLTHGWKVELGITTADWASCKAEICKFCKNDKRTRLMLHMLSGIIERKYAKYAGDSYSGAAILEVKKCKGTREFLLAVAHSFGRELSCRSKTIEMTLPLYLPVNVRKNRVEENAYITGTGKGKLRFPAAYPDAAVILDNAVLDKREVEKFVKANKHCQIVVVDHVPKSVQDLVSETLDAKDLEVEVMDWDVHCLHDMTQAFASASILRKTDEAIQYAERIVNKYLEDSEIKFTSQYHVAELYIATAMLLANFIKNVQHLTEGEMSDLCNTLFNAVLPGCYTPPKDSGVALENIALTPENFEDALCEVISKTVEDTSKLSIPSDREWDKSSAAPESACYGYLTEMEVDKTHKNKVPSIQFHHEVFLDLFERFCPYKVPERTQVESWLRNYIVGKGLAYCHDRDRSRDRFGADGLKPSVRLLIHNLDFLAEEKRQELLDAFDTKDTPAEK